MRPHSCVVLDVCLNALWGQVIAGRSDDAGKTRNAPICVSDSSLTVSDTDEKPVPVQAPRRRPSGARAGYCHLCRGNVMDMMFYPCQHASICHECFCRMQDPKRCTVCNRKITKPVLFYLTE
jgi:hypothetical protein